MNQIKGLSRHQVAFGSLEDSISAENPVRVIDAFVDKLDLNQLGFVQREIKSEGRPGFENHVFLKIYLYGYVNGIRSSRKLERECSRNIELQWLTGKLTPNYHSIADFRKNNPGALRNLFKLFITFLKDIDLIGGKTIAIDGTKVRSNNSKKNNYNPKKIERHLVFIEQKSNEYLSMLEASDTEEDQVRISEVQQKLQRLKEKKIDYQILQKQLEDSGEPQISTTDKDSRALLVQGQVVEISYNMQAAVDDKHNLIVATHTINRNDRNALSAIALEAKKNLSVDKFTVLVDKGYHNGRELNILTCVHKAAYLKQRERGTKRPEKGTRINLKSIELPIAKHVL
jgi:transposase